MPRGADSLSRSRIFNDWNDYGMPAGLTSAGTPMPLYVSGTGVLGVDLLSEAIAVSIENVHVKTISAVTPTMTSGAQHVWLASALDALTDDIGIGLIAGVTPTMVSGQPIMDIKATTAITRRSIDVNTSGDNTIIPAASGLKLKVTSCMLVVAGDVDMRFESDAGGTALSGVMSFAADGNGFVWPPAMPGYHWIETAASNLLNLELSAAVQVGGFINYYPEA